MLTLLYIIYYMYCVMYHISFIWYVLCIIHIYDMLYVLCCLLGSQIWTLSPESHRCSSICICNRKQKTEKETKAKAQSKIYSKTNYLQRKKETRRKHKRPKGRPARNPVPEGRVQRVGVFNCGTDWVWVLERKNFGFGQGWLKCGVSSELNLCHFFGS